MKPTATLAATAAALVLLALLIVIGGRAGLLDGADQTANSGSTASAATSAATSTGSRSPRASPESPGRRPTPAASSPQRDPETGLRFVEYAALPSQARDTIDLIERGGPFPYAKDGATFGNRERLLPGRQSGYYREYTVRTPGEADRGARRIVTGDRDRAFFYTADHYASFARVRR